VRQVNLARREHGRSSLDSGHAWRALGEFGPTYVDICKCITGSMGWRVTHVEVSPKAVDDGERKAHPAITCL